MFRENITEVGAIEDVLECGKDFDPNRWSVFTRDESVLLCQHLRLGAGRCENSLASIEEDEPCEYGQSRKEELSCDRQDQRT